MRLIDNTYIDKSPIHGYGVFANTDIKKGEVVMECVIPLEMLVKNTYTLGSYRFAWRDDEYTEDFVPLGNAGVCNSSDKNHTPNFEWKLDSVKIIGRQWQIILYSGR